MHAQPVEGALERGGALGKGREAIRYWPPIRVGSLTSGRAVMTDWICSLEKPASLSSSYSLVYRLSVCLLGPDASADPA